MLMATASIESPGEFQVDTNAEFRSIIGTLRNTRVAVLCGEAGAGKSTIVGQFWRHEGSRVVGVQCSPFPGRPLEPVVALAAALLDDVLVPVRSPLQRHALECLTGRRGPDETTLDREWALEMLANTLASRTVPTIAIVEDVHLAPPLTKRVLRQLVGRVAERRGRTLVVLTERIEPGVDPSIRFAAGRFTEIDVQPWGIERIEEFLIGCGGSGDWIPDAAIQIKARSGGNPRFVRELADEILVERRPVRY